MFEGDSSSSLAPEFIYTTGEKVTYTSQMQINYIPSLMDENFPEVPEK